jgi:hypothetical protein
MCQAPHALGAVSAVQHGGGVASGVCEVGINEPTTQTKRCES